MIGRLRGSFATKLLAAGLALALLLVGGVSAYLIVSRDRQTSGAALSNADNRAAVLAQVVVNFTGGQSLSAARSLAAQPALLTALADPDPATAVTDLFSRSAPVDLSGEIVMVSDVSGAIVYEHGAPDLTGVTLPDTLPGSATGTLTGTGRCALRSDPATDCGIELLGGQPAYDVAVPVVSAGRIIGVVAYLAPLRGQLGRYHALLGYPVAFIDVADPNVLMRVGDSGVSASTTPGDLAAAVTSHAASAHALYPGPGGDQVAGSFLPLAGPDGSVAGWVGVEAPLSGFIGDTRTDELTLALIGGLAVLVTIIAVSLFVSRVVWRPISRLERGVARIAGGDYDTPIEITSRDELGRLAGSVNRMRERIDEYVGEISSAHQRLDHAVETMSSLSRALTGTAAGVAELEREVLSAAAAIGGAGCGAWMALRDGHTLVMSSRQASDGLEMRLPAREVIDRVLAGEPVLERAGEGGESLMVAPMFLQNQVVGGLAVVAAGDRDLSGEQDVLAVLANNAAIARENARLFEQERETVRRLRELDAMKTDFLGTVHHELRTPLTAILGLSDLIEMCWAMWDDGPKLEAVRDIQVAAKNLYDIVETIIEFSALDGEDLGLSPEPVTVVPAIEQALTAVAERYKGGITIPVEIDVAADAQMYGDRDRIDQVLRAVLDNAVKFSDGEGRVRVTAHTERRRIRLEVNDSGIGIPADDIKRVFERFYQVDNSATRKFGGTGMGLALVKRIVQAHGARVEIESERGTGTTVILDWPAVVEACGGEARRVAEERGDVPARPAPARRQAVSA